MKTDSTIAGIYGFDRRKRLVRPLFSCGVSAGFPSPAEDYIDGRLDLNELLIRNSAATFFVRVSGDSMIGAGINHDDILVVDRSLEPASGRVVIAAIHGELTVKRLVMNNGTCRLLAENPEYASLEVSDEMPCEIWGVVTAVIRQL